MSHGIGDAVVLDAAAAPTFSTSRSRQCSRKRRWWRWLAATSIGTRARAQPAPLALRSSRHGSDPSGLPRLIVGALGMGLIRRRSRVIARDGRLFAEWAPRATGAATPGKEHLSSPPQHVT